MARKQCKTPKLEPVQCQKRCAFCSNISNETGSLRFSLLQMLLLRLLLMMMVLPLFHIFLIAFVLCLSFTFHLFGSRAVENIQHEHTGTGTTDCVSFRFHEIHNRSCILFLPMPIQLLKHNICE